MPFTIKECDSTQSALQKIKARENVLKQLEKIARLGSWEVDLLTKESRWSDESYTIYGIEKGTKTDLNLFFSLILSEDLQNAQQILHQAITTGKVTSFRCRAKKADTGAIIHLLLNGQVIYDEAMHPIKIIGTTQDITEQINLEQTARELSEILEKSSNEIYILDFNTYHYLYVNEGACRALGYTKEEMLGMNVFDVNPHLTLAQTQQMKEYAKHNPYIINRTIHRRKDGTCYHALAHLHKIEFQQKEAFVIFDTDISDTTELQLKHERQSKILENIRESVISIDLQGVITSWNRGSQNLLGYSESEILGSSLEKIYKPEDEKKLPFY